MKKLYGKKLVAAVVMGLSLSLAGVGYAAAETTTVAVQVDVQQKETKGVVNWDKGANADIEVVGIGLPPENAGARGKALARRAAVVDAYRNLAETVKGVQVDSETTMEDLTIKNDLVKTKVSALVKGARVIEEAANEDGSYMVKMSIPMYGVNSVAAIALPEITKDVPTQPIEAPSADFVPPAEVEAQAATYTGVVIDAAGMGLEGTFSPVIYDTNGRAVYGMRNIDYNLAISQGMVEYASDLQVASAHSRASANPLVVKATAVRGGDNSVNPVNVVVSVEDADKILYANEKSGMLNNRAVVFVK